ncbi:hypothetical protein EDEG_00456 [Edhazardia aedis USNM 41457]|uniref:Uncharacterized protein n=1 Tax=Edhazardia aedis (strain USNM 41457) TaxID=1003232 RepID=J9D1F5_EDHAE|nr:hypothetical protein EDEG_00456 [Edhazardia aedis USNM 41457]|eukprot:EJW01409.1 hypothetical protein EDEG_00456 [Edhazardia aedis USNM 41457]
MEPINTGESDYQETEEILRQRIKETIAENLKNQRQCIQNDEKNDEKTYKEIECDLKYIILFVFLMSLVDYFHVKNIEYTSNTRFILYIVIPVVNYFIVNNAKKSIEHAFFRRKAMMLESITKTVFYFCILKIIIHFLRNGVVYID